MNSLLEEIRSMELRKTEEEDLPRVLACERRYPQFVGQWQEERHQQALADPDCYHGVLWWEGFAGFVILRGLENPNRSIELMRIAVEQPGQGAGGQALALVQRFCFEELSANRLWLDVRQQNQRAQRAYAAAGFLQEGLLREAVLVNGSYESLYVMSQLRGEYLDEQKNTHR